MDVNLDINGVTIGIQIAATILLFIVVAIFFAKPMKSFLAKRNEFFAEEFTKAQHANEEALLLKEQADLELKKIKDEAGQMLESATVKAQEKYENILATAKSDAEAETLKARKRIDKERETMLYDAQKEIAKTATDVASKLIKKEIDIHAHDDLFDDFVQLIGGGGNE